MLVLRIITPLMWWGHSWQRRFAHTVAPGWTGSVGIPNPTCHERVVIGPSSSYSNLYYGNL